MGNAADVTIGSAAVTWNSVDLGFIAGGVEFHYEPEFHGTKVDAHTGIIKHTLVRERAYALVNMAESSLGKLQAAMPAGVNTAGSLTVGDGTPLSAAELVITPTDTDAKAITIYKAISIGAIALNHVVDGERIVQVSFEAEVDTSKSAGNRLFKMA